MHSVLLSLKEVFSRPTYIALAVALAAIVYVSGALLPNYMLIVSVFGSADVSFGTKIELLTRLLSGVASAAGIVAAAAFATAAILSGLVFALAVFFVVSARQLGAGFAGAASSGLVATFVGIGCAVCGSGLLAAFVPLAISGAVLALLPLHGAEFSLAAVVLLALALFIIARQIARRGLCEA